MSSARATSTDITSARLGIFVGGRSTRMGEAKGLLWTPEGGERLVERLARVGREAGCELCLVGAAEPYAGLLEDVPRLEDQPTGVGPLGGLGALLADDASDVVITVACDMPYVDADALRALLAFAPTAPCVAARRGPDAPYEPMLARWSPSAVRPQLQAALAAGERSFQALFRRMVPVELPLTPALERSLTDWDTPEDRRRGVGTGGAQS